MDGIALRNATHFKALLHHSTAPDKSSSARQHRARLPWHKSFNSSAALMSASVSKCLVASIMRTTCKCHKSSWDGGVLSLAAQDVMQYKERAFSAQSIQHGCRTIQLVYSRLSCPIPLPQGYYYHEIRHKSAKLRCQNAPQSQSDRLVMSHKAQNLSQTTGFGVHPTF